MYAGHNEGYVGHAAFYLQLTTKTCMKHRGDRTTKEAACEIVSSYIKVKLG